LVRANERKEHHMKHFTHEETGHGHRRRGFRPPFPPGFAAGGPGFGGGFGPGFGPFGPRGRARRGDVRLAVLSLLAENPNNGYGLIKAIAEKTDDAWRASPGSVYPTLAQLVDEGLVATDDNVYQLTEAGRTYVAEHADEFAAVWADAAAPGDKAELRIAARKLFGAIRQVAIEAAPEKQAEVAGKLDALRKDLYRLLAE
jgi:DNA-binding PadR family transcriptional regulator